MQWIDLPLGCKWEVYFYFKNGAIHCKTVERIQSLREFLSHILVRPWWDNKRCIRIVARYRFEPFLDMKPRHLRFILEFVKFKTYDVCSMYPNLYPKK